MPLRGYDKETVVIVIRIDGDEAEKNIGVVVDAVSDVMRAAIDDISKTPDFGARLSTDFMVGVATADDKMIMLLDVNRLQPPEAAGEAAEASVA